MATIVEFQPNGKCYILIGAGYGKSMSSRPGRLLGEMFPTDKSEESSVVAVCDSRGRIRWFQPEHLRVVSVNGVTPSELLA